MTGFFRRRDPLLAGIATALLTGGVSAGAGADALGPYAWQNRPLFVYAPTENAPGLIAQRAALTPYLDAMRARDMVWIEVVGDTVSARLGTAPDMAAEALRSIHGIAAKDEKTVLVGKDTGVKLRSSVAVQPSDLFGLIDSMPMRQNEIRAHQATEALDE